MYNNIRDQLENPVYTFEYIWGFFILMEDYMEKHYTTFRGKLERLRDRGMDIPKDKSKERNILKRYNYYNLINAYKDPFLVTRENYPSYADPNEDFYLNGTRPSHLESVLKFDENLRLIFLERILKIEEHLKNVIVQSFYEHHTDMGNNKLVDSLHRESEYLRRDYYDLKDLDTYTIQEKSGYRYTVLNSVPRKDDTMKYNPRKYTIGKDQTYHTLIAIIYKQIGQQRRKNESIRSYLDNHTYLPMWILSNILTFGNISRLFEILTHEVQLLVLQKLNFTLGNMDNELNIINTSRVIHILGLFRNSCAHNERLYCSNIHTPIDDDFMGYLSKFPQSERVLQLKGNTRFLNRRQAQKLDHHRHSIYTLMFCISLFLNKKDLTKFKNEIKKELTILEQNIPETPYKNISKIMGLNFDWYNYLVK